MHISDPGPRPNAFDIEKATVENNAYRTVAWTGKYLQVTLMSIPVGQSIGLEVHPETDQFLRLEAGKGKCVMGPSQHQLDFEQDVEDDWSIQVPAGVWHNVINAGEEPMRLYAIYAPVHHARGIVQATAQDAERDEEAGTDKPPAWTVQPVSTSADQHAEGQPGTPPSTPTTPAMTTTVRRTAEGRASWFRIDNGRAHASHCLMHESRDVRPHPRFVDAP